jgi:hypothetical protein
MSRLLPKKWKLVTENEMLEYHFYPTSNFPARGGSAFGGQPPISIFWEDVGGHLLGFMVS